MSDLRERIHTYILKELLHGESAVALDFDTNLLMEGLVDSLGMVRLLAYLQEELALTIPPEDVTIENFVSIDAMHNYLDQRIKS